MNDTSTEKVVASKPAPCDFLDSEETQNSEVNACKFCRDYIIAILREQLYAGRDGMTEAEIVAEFIKEINVRDNCEYTYRDKQPTVSKALKKLVGNGVEKLGKKYHLVDKTNAKEIAKELIFQKVRFEKKSVFRISKSTVVVYPARESIDKAKKYLWNYLSSKNCYGIIELDGYLVVMLLGKSAKLQELRTDITNLVAEVYEKQPKKK